MRKWLAFFGLLTATGFLSAAGGAADSGEVLETGSRAPYQHLINLYDREGKQIDPKSTAPYSPTQTCGKCHQVETINHGWHFNAGDPAALKTNRPAEPWIISDEVTWTQLPFSTRGQSGVASHQDLGLTPWRFTQIFGARTPGGGLADRWAEVPKDPKSRWKISGKLETDCLLCHSSDGSYFFQERQRQIEKENFAYVPTAAIGLGVVKGQASRMKESVDPDLDLGDNPDQPTVVYDKNRFDPQNAVRLNVTRNPPAQLCYQCHSNRQVGPTARPGFQHDRDIHLARGMSCQDCHRHGMDHQVSRGYLGEAGDRKNADLATLSCKGCHMGDASASRSALRTGGRLGAPKPIHRGLPPLHLEKLSCTACHSGTDPIEGPRAMQTTMAHRLGVTSESRSAESAPHLLETLFLRNPQGQIASYRGLWPSYFGTLEKDGKITPLLPEAVQSRAGLTASAHAAKAPDDAAMVEMLKKLNAAGQSPVVFIGGGKLHRLSDRGTLEHQDHPAAALVAWPLGHDVRGASQALGARGCTDCHSSGAPIDFGAAAASFTASLVAAPPIAFHALRGDELTPIQLRNYAFAMRPFFKIFAFSCLALLAMVLVADSTLVLLQSRGRVAAASLTASRAGILDRLAMAGFVFGFGLLSATGLWCLIRGESLSGNLLLAHMNAAGFLIPSLTFLALRGLQRGGLFWWVGLAGLVVSLSVLFTMLPLLGLEGIGQMLLIHRYSSLVMVGLVAIWIMKRSGRLSK